MIQSTQPPAQPGEIDYTTDPVVTIAIQLDETIRPTPEVAK